LDPEEEICFSLTSAPYLLFHLPHFHAQDGQSGSPTPHKRILAFSELKTLAEVVYCTDFRIFSQGVIHSVVCYRILDTCIHILVWK